MTLEPNDRTANAAARRPATGAVLSLVVALVLGDAGVVTLALPAILHDFAAGVWGVAWVLIAFNVVLALAAVPAARACLRRDPITAGAVGILAFAAATCLCAAAPSLGVLIAARAAQAAAGALVIVGSLVLLVHADDAEHRAARRWTLAGVAGAALGPVAGGLLTWAFSWRSIFVTQIPLALLALPAVAALRRAGVPRRAPVDLAPHRPHAVANLALALLSAALTAALFLLVLLLVDGWRRSPAVAALAVTMIPASALAAGRIAGALRAGIRSEVVAGSLLIAGGLAGLALLPAPQIAWTLAPQALVGLGLGLSVDALTAAALRDRAPLVLHGGWTIAARHAGVVIGLAILTPIFTADLRHVQTPAEEAVAGLVLDAPLPVSAKVRLAERLQHQLGSEQNRIPDLRPAFANLALPPAQAPAAARLEHDLENELRRAATRAFRTAFLVAAALALLAIVPGLALPGQPRR